MPYSIPAEDMREGGFVIYLKMWLPCVGPKTFIEEYTLPLQNNKMPALRSLAAWLGVKTGRSPKKAALAAAIQEELVFPDIA